jgi:molybdopterin synthase catalytic subunit
MEVQDPRGTLWTIHHSTGMLKGGEDVVSVYLVQR